MTKDVLVSVIGTQGTDENDSPEPIELVTSGTYYHKNGTHYLFYEETPESSDMTIRNFIEFTPERAEVRKKGLVNTTLTFEVGKHTVSPYQNPFGTMEAGISATEIRLNEREDEIDLKLFYALTMGGVDMADCAVQIRIMAREPAVFE